MRQEIDIDFIKWCKRQLQEEREKDIADKKKIENWCRQKMKEEREKKLEEEREREYRRKKEAEEERRYREWKEKKELEQIEYERNHPFSAYENSYKRNNDVDHW